MEDFKYIAKNSYNELSFFIGKENFFLAISLILKQVYVKLFFIEKLPNLIVSVVISFYVFLISEVMNHD